ncbi:ion channel [Bordetella sp. FB-8]|uniref:ion channel n=1 Tax=Bordetella sp. FB-8 TaxID=1159870 RepID=UPI00037F0821|nr:ion channel [Bordetella sp. FB-8]
MSELSHRAAFSKRFALGFSGRARMIWTRLYRSLRMRSWFPHVPLALAVGLAGFVQVWPSQGSLREAASFFAAPREVSDLSRGFNALAIHGVSQDLVGGLLIMLSLGLLLHSRLAWVLTLLMTAATVGLQFMPHAQPLPAVTAYSGVLLVLLILAYGSFQRASLATGTLFALIGVLLTVGYGVLGSYTLGHEFAPPIADFDSALYFTVVTMSTVGYGDIVPHTAHARLFTASLIILGLVVFATSLTAIAGPLINQRMMNLLQPRKKKMKRTDHIIVIGNTALARSTVKALTARGLHVTAIWQARASEGVQEPEDLVIGDASDNKVLESAGIANARAVLALGADDSDNAFATLAAKDANAQVRTVLAVSDARSMSRVRHVRPDAVLALPAIGGELLAMVLSGEEINLDELLGQLLKLGDAESA